MKHERVTPYNVGRFVLSEDACNASCLDFRAYEQGVSDAADAFGRDPLNTHAPALLAACRMVTSLRRVGGMLPGVRELLDTVVAEAEAAIAKATGEQA